MRHTWYAEFFCDAILCQRVVYFVVYTYVNICARILWNQFIWITCFLLQMLKPRSHCADHSLPMFPIIADRPGLSWSWQNHQIVAITPDLCLSKTACLILVRQLYDIGTTEVFDPLFVRFWRPLIRSTRLHSRCWRPHPRSCRFATMIKTT